MKFLYWNIRRIANSPSKLALKNLILSHHPDFIFIAKPWMAFDRFPYTWLNRLGLKIFSLNTKLNLLPNLWCICASNLDPTVIDSDDQQVSFTLMINNTTTYFYAIYASTSNPNKKNPLGQTEFPSSLF